MGCGNSKADATAAAAAGGAGDAPSDKKLLLVNSNPCCPESLALKMVLDTKGVQFEEMMAEVGSQEEWFKKVCPDGDTPVFAWMPKTSQAKDDVMVIPELSPDNGKSPTLFACVKWLEQAYPQTVKVLPTHDKFEEIEAQTKELASSIPMICMAPKPPVQKEKRAVAVAAMKKLDGILQSSGGKTVLGTETFTYLDCILLTWLYRYPIMVHWRSWTPETKPGTVSEEDAPSVEESAMPTMAAYRLAGLKKFSHVLPSKEFLVAWSEKKVKRPSPMSAGRLQHQSFRWWMKEVKGMLAKLEAQPSDQATADKAADCWDRYAKFMKEHSVMEDDVIYKVFEEQKPGCTSTSSSEHAHEMPLLLASVEKVKGLASKQGRGEADVKAIKEEIEKMCDSLEAHLVGEETHLFPILESLDMQIHYDMFPKAFKSCDAERSELFAFVLQGLSLSEQEQYWRNIIDYAKLDANEIKTIHAAMRLHFDKSWLNEEKVQRLENRVPELKALREGQQPN